MPEVARTIIDQAIASGKTLSQIRADEKEFQSEVLEHKIEIEKNHPKDLLTFFDRGIHDTLAYLQLGKYEIEERVLEATRPLAYKKVFLLEPLNKYIKDYARSETLEEALKLNHLLYEVFSKYKMEPIKVPPLSPAARAAFVLRHVP